MDLVPRSDWGARPPRSSTAIATVAGVAVHWEGPAMGTPAHDRCDDHVRSIQRFHMDTRGWADIAYNFVVCPHGAIFEGRGWGVRSAANGTAAANAAYHAACYLGGTGDPFTPAARAAYVALVAEARRRYPAGTAVRPHSAFKATDCPGGVIRAWLATDPFAPVPAPTPPPWEADVPKPTDFTSSCTDPATGGFWVQTARGGVDGHDGARVHDTYLDHPELGGNVRYFPAIVADGAGGFTQVANDGARYHFGPPAAA